MRIRNPRDFWAGAIYLALAIAVIWIGQNYQHGTSERMGPGYFPTALGSILAIFGVVSIGRSFIRPGEAISAIAWRPLALVLGSAVLFGLLLTARGRAHRAAVPDRRQRACQPQLPARRNVDRRPGRPCRILCRGVRQRTWRADAADRHLVRRVGADNGRAGQSCPWLPDGDEPVESPLLSRRGLPRHRRRRAARHRTDRYDRDAVADHVRPAAGLGTHHAVGHLLRRPVRRIDHRHPDQPSRRIGIGGDGARRLSDGAPGQGRPGARNSRHRVVHRRNGGDAAGRSVRAPSGGGGASVRAGRVFLADGARPRRLDRAGKRFAPACACRGRRRPGARDLSAPTSIQACHATASGSRSLPTALASSSSPWACSVWPRSSRISSTRERGAPQSRV